jgi:hypothetical protein
MVKNDIKKLKIVYVAGPYRNKNFFKKLKNIFTARKYAKRIWEFGVGAICPHSNTAFFSEKNNDHILNSYLKIMSNCDAIFVLPDYAFSFGTQEEIKLAEKLKLPIYYYWQIETLKYDIENNKLK